MVSALAGIVITAGVVRHMPYLLKTVKDIEAEDAVAAAKALADGTLPVTAKASMLSTIFALPMLAMRWVIAPKSNGVRTVDAAPTVDVAPSGTATSSLRLAELASQQTATQ
jgi:hypothetical protein